MAELSLAERSTIEAVVDGMQRRAMKQRKRARQGWAFLLTGALSIPIISASFDGTITMTTAASRIAIALVITTGIISMVGSLFDSYQGQAAVATVQDAVIEARRKADEMPDDADAAADSFEALAKQGAGASSGGSDDGDDDER
ncbi:MAG: hypothetical protein AAGA90_16410 [Actinomycetota bacterium]